MEFYMVPKPYRMSCRADKIAYIMLEVFFTAIILSMGKISWGAVFCLLLLDGIPLWMMYSQRDWYRLCGNKVIFAEEIRAVDRKGRVILRLDYSEINGFEPREVYFAAYSKYGRPERTIAREMILIYHGDCLGFDTLNLKNWYTMDNEAHYSMKEICDHPHCVALAFDEKALRILAQRR